MFKDSRIAIHPDTTILADLGYQGIDKFHSNSLIPVKRKKKLHLTPIDKKYNRQLASLRCSIEHVNRRCKIFRVVKELYRGKHKNFSKTWNLIAGLVNYRYNIS